MITPPEQHLRAVQMAATQVKLKDLDTRITRAEQILKGAAVGESGQAILGAVSPGQCVSMIFTMGHRLTEIEKQLGEMRLLQEVPAAHAHAPKDDSDSDIDEDQESEEQQVRDDLDTEILVMPSSLADDSDSDSDGAWEQESEDDNVEEILDDDEVAFADEQEPEQGQMLEATRDSSSDSSSDNNDAGDDADVERERYDKYLSEVQW